MLPTEFEELHERGLRIIAELRDAGYIEGIQYPVPGFGMFTYQMTAEGRNAWRKMLEREKVDKGRKTA